MTFFLGNPVLSYLRLVADEENPPLVHSISWGPPESHLTPAEAATMNSQFLMLSTQGLTFITSSGDDGVNNRNARGNPTNCGLDPQYPAGVPYVTTVGGTFGVLSLVAAVVHVSLMFFVFVHLLPELKLGFSQTSGPDFGLETEISCATDVPGMPATTTSGGGFSMWYASYYTKRFCFVLKSYLLPP